jgi:hypothetical protein
MKALSNKHVNSPIIQYYSQQRVNNVQPANQLVLQGKPPSRASRNEPAQSYVPMQITGSPSSGLGQATSNSTYNLQNAQPYVEVFYAEQNRNDPGQVS